MNKNKPTKELNLHLNFRMNQIKNNKLPNKLSYSIRNLIIPLKSLKKIKKVRKKLKIKIKYNLYKIINK